MGAIFSRLVPYAHKGLTAVRTCQVVFCSGLTATVGIPPRRAALVRTELPCSVLVLYLDGLAALPTDRRGGYGFFTEPGPAAVSLYRVFRN